MKYESLPISDWATLLTKQPEALLSTNRGQYTLHGFKTHRKNQWVLLLYDAYGSGNWYNLDEEILPMRPVLQHNKSVKLYKEIPDYRPFTSCEFVKYLEGTKGQLNIKYKPRVDWYQSYSISFVNGDMELLIAGEYWTLNEMFDKFVFVNPESKEEIVFGMMY